MRAISLVQRIEFDFTGSVVRDAIALGDVDNDGRNELIVGNEKGDVTIFKGREKMQCLKNLSFVSCVAVGDILNCNKNCLVIVTADGWCYIYDKVTNCEKEDEENVEQVDGQIHSSSTAFDTVSTDTVSSLGIKPEEIEVKNELTRIHVQRIPANTKNILLGDVDGDGKIEMVLGLTDRVVRSYRWVNNLSKSTANLAELNSPFEAGCNLGKLMALNKWECANQIGSITLHHSDNGKPSLLIAQPGGTFMRIRCSSDDASQGLLNSDQSASSSSHSEQTPGVDYQSLGIKRMRSPIISTEILGDFKSGFEVSQNFDKASIQSDGTGKSENSKGCPYAVATLDGTIMLVQDEVILWAMAVDHQIFALTKLDVTGNGTDDIVVCSWDGQTYILDQDKNVVRFHLNEPVQAFTSGYYNIEPNEPAYTCLVYVTFKKKVIIYYDIPLKELKCHRFEPDADLLSKLFIHKNLPAEESMDFVNNMDKKTKRELVEYLLYNVKS